VDGEVEEAEEAYAVVGAAGPPGGGVVSWGWREGEGKGMGGGEREKKRATNLHVPGHVTDLVDELLELLFVLDSGITGQEVAGLGRQGLDLLLVPWDVLTWLGLLPS